MPRRFRKEEEETIRKALLAAGARIMGLRGVRKTSIDELVREAGISKGSFYRFFPGKEALALEILARWEREFHGAIQQLFRARAPRGVAEAAAVLRDIFMEEFPRRVAESGLQGLMLPEEIAHIARIADAEQMRLMDEQDLRFFAGLNPLLQTAGLEISVPDEIVIAAFRLLFDAALGILSNKPDGPLSREHFDGALTLLIQGLLSRGFAQENQDNER